MSRTILTSLVALAVLATGGLLVFSQPAQVSAQEGSSPSMQQVPVESDMHEFMEYINQPSFKRLKKEMAKADDGLKWGAIKSEALTLAEVGNLLMIRKPSNDADDWAQHAVTVRENGRKLYVSAKAKQVDGVRASYREMIKNCNQCHEQFAGGEHILTP
ncbi:cytochrome c [Stratiformator vulcanicus]|uniref:Cytochrome C n=1 Tax=Stratiformator vulcanicus TaxID=2527980 RepID=A0A517QYT4_9PLAN|nr:cytochrome c [Stratiformator vulcanicus]QDT36809.1 hypothetical protein Pan189_11720 [Stratiformator vulcanicus]